jgi:hypothetical protein
MGLELKHLGQTLTLGGLAVYGIIFLLRIYTQKMTPNFFKLEADKSLRLRSLYHVHVKSDPSILATAFGGTDPEGHRLFTGSPA